MLPPALFQSTLPVGGATGKNDLEDIKMNEFQSTLPVGGATFFSSTNDIIFEFQSTLPVGGATWDEHHKRNTLAISIHAPRGGSDSAAEAIGKGQRDFNPRSPWGERRYFFIDTFVGFGISIHAPRGGSDFRLRFYCVGDFYFNPRSPWGERQQRCTNSRRHLWRECSIWEIKPRESGAEPFQKQG